MHTTNAPVANDWNSRSHVQTIVMMVTTAIGIYLCYLMAMPFLSALIWALALAVVFLPFHLWLELKLKRSNLAAVFSALLVGLIVVVPTTFIGQRLITQAAKGAQLVTAKVESGDWRRAVESHPRLNRLADKIEQQFDLPGTVQSLTAWLTNTTKSIVKGSVIQVLGFLLTFYLLFFFLRDRRAVLHLLRSLAPLSEVEMDQLLSRVNDTIYATIYGTLAVSAVQGLLGGLMFWWLGLPAPLLWGVVMAVLAVLPVLGAFVVWIPAALFLVLAGSWGKALILAVWGLIVVGGLDNLLRPILVGNRLKLHTVIVFMSVVGGLILFGPVGLILGPVVLTITVVLLEIWRRRREDRCGLEEAGTTSR
ncbi:MAG: AI-2E family transporter [Lentisphaerae bacterium RIFOXYA12_FULL_48_11]|nr:MAG: AI-2E family transporter [Lentisphaerae bacterium RIFOXYA12_FULL_48_11]